MRWPFDTMKPMTREAAEILVKSQPRFVVKVASEYAKFGFQTDRVGTGGNVGLMHAVKEYNPYKGLDLLLMQFGGYAAISKNI